LATIFSLLVRNHGLLPPWSWGWAFFRKLSTSKSIDIKKTIVCSHNHRVTHFFMGGISLYPHYPYEIPTFWLKSHEFQLPPDRAIPGLWGASRQGLRRALSHASLCATWREWKQGTFSFGVIKHG
jgi:hypothetical protein